MSAEEYSTSEAFGAQMVNILNQASLALMTSIGHQVGLFDVMATLPASSSQAIADAAGLNERYVREWLAVMVTGKIIDYQARNGTYSLPPEHALWLTRAAGTNNMAFYCQYIPLLAAVEQGIVSSFRNGSGVPYSEYPRFQQLMAEDSATIHDAGLLNTTLPLVPGLPERLDTGIKVLDVGCGSGHALNLMAHAFPNSKFTGYDLSADAIAKARAEATQMGLANVHFDVHDVTKITEKAKFDLITAFDAIHDQAAPLQVLQNIARALKPDGTFFMVDVRASSHLHENMEHPMAPFFYTFSCMHCMTVSLAQNGAGLGAMWGEQLALNMLQRAGFTRVAVKQVDADFFNNYYIATKS